MLAGDWYCGSRSDEYNPIRRPAGCWGGVCTQVCVCVWLSLCPVMAGACLYFHHSGILIPKHVSCRFALYKLPLLTHVNSHAASLKPALPGCSNVDIEALFLFVRVQHVIIIAMKQKEELGNFKVIPSPNHLKLLPNCHVRCCSVFF